MAIIDAEAGGHRWPAAEWSVVRRMIHTTADFDYLHNARFSPDALARGLEALRRGCAIFTDTNMAKAGIARLRLERWGCPVECLIGRQWVAQRAERLGITRASAAVDAAVESLQGAIYVIGNAPTALFTLLEHLRKGRCRPALIVGLPVGFVNAAESKEALTRGTASYITAVGRKGGSAVAASVVNALAMLAEEEKAGA
jgi:precorrin-8X/cobalt-precorrin-8 methylmutase